VTKSNWERLAPLTGVLFVILVVLGFSVGGSTPGVHDSAQEVQSYWADHHSKQVGAAFLVLIGAVFLVFFASSLRHALRAAGGTGRLANAAFGAGLIATTGFWIMVMVHIALAEAGADAKTLGTTQTLSVLDNNSFFPAAGGLGVLVFAAGLSTLRHGGLPTWLGWIGVVLGVAVFTPAGFFGFLGAGLWILVVSIVLSLAVRTSPQAAVGTGGVDG
jgi:hypothetical protein